MICREFRPCEGTGEKPRRLKTVTRRRAMRARRYGAQALVSSRMDPRLETKPKPKPPGLPRPDAERMNVLVASSGSAATLRQNEVILPSCARYCSTFERYNAPTVASLALMYAATDWIALGS